MTYNRVTICDLSSQRISQLFIKAFSCALFSYATVEGQSVAPVSGDVTVRLIQGLDSAAGRPGQTSAARVVKSTNTSVTTGSSAVVQLVSDPTGSFGVRLVAVGVNGHILRTASSAAALAAGVFEKANNLLRSPGSPQDSTSGARVFLPSGTEVRFSLMAAQQRENEAAARPQVARAAAENPRRNLLPPKLDTSVATWEFRNMEGGAHAAYITGIAEAGEKHGPAALGISCKASHYAGSMEAYATVTYKIRIPRRLVGFSTGELNCEGDGAGNDYARIRIGNQPERKGDFCYNQELPQNPNEAVEMEFVPPDLKAPVFSPATPMEVSLRLPQTQADAIVTRFQLPPDAAALQTMTSPCFQILDDQARKEEAARVVSCPEIAGKTLQDVSVLVGPTMKKLSPDPDNDIGIAWYLPKKTKARPLPPRTTLACYYGIGSKSDKDNHEAQEKKLIPIPATASYCVFRSDGHCSTSAGKN